MKKLYSIIIVLAAFMVIFTYKANAEVKYPAISSIALDHSPLVEGESEGFYVVSDYDGPVQYKVKIVSMGNTNTTGNTNSTIVFKPVAVEYGDVIDGRYPFKIAPSTRYSIGMYKAVVYVKRAGETGRYKNNDCDYDNLYTFNLNCVNKNDRIRVYANGNMDISKTTYKLGDTITINGVKNIKGMQSPYKYKLHVFDVRNNQWLKNVTEYNDNIEWTPENGGDYILDVWITSSDSTAKYEAWKVIPVTVVDEFKIDYIKAQTPNIVIAKFNNKPKLTDIQNKSNYYISTSSIDTATLLKDGRSVQLKLKKSIASETLYFVDSIRYDADNSLASEPFASTERYEDDTQPYVKQITCDADKAKIVFSEAMKTLGNAKLIQGDQTVDVSNLLIEGDNYITADVKGFSPNENISFVALGAKDMFDNNMDPNPYSIYFKKNRTDYTKPTVASVKALSTTRVEVTFSERLKNAPIVTVGTKPVNFDSFSTSDNITFEGTVPLMYGKENVKVISYKDMSGNAGDIFEQDTDFKLDETQPQAKGSELDTFNNKLYLVIHFDEAVKTSGSSYLIGQYMKKVSGSDVAYDFMKNISVVPYQKSYGTDFNDSKSVMVDISDNSYFPPASYKLTVPENFVRDINENYNGSKEGSVAFDKSKYYGDSSKPYVTGSPGIADDYSYIDITFSEEMGLGSVSILENYKANGICIFNRAELLPDWKHVRLYIAKEFINYSGDRMLEISGLKDKYGNEMEKYRKIIYLRENEKPYVDYAVTESQTILKIVFNETVRNVSGDCFNVYINGSMVDRSKVRLVNKSAYSKQVWLYFDNSINLRDSNNYVQIKVDSQNISDMSGNYMDSGTYIDVMK